MAARTDTVQGTQEAAVHAASSPPGTEADVVDFDTPVLSASSAKGGVGKTTLTVNVAVEAALRGIDTVVLDCDLNQHATQFGEAFCAYYPDAPIRFVRGVHRDNLLDYIDEAKANAGLVVIDLPAGTSTLAMSAIMSSHLVLVPTQRTALDARDAVRTAIQVADAERHLKHPVASVLVWTMVGTQFPSSTEIMVQDGMRENLVDPDRGILRNVMQKLDAFQAAFVHGFAAREVAQWAGKDIEWPPGAPTETLRIPRSAAKAAENIRALTDEILERLGTIVRGGNPGLMRLRPDVIAEFKKNRSMWDGV